MWDSYAAKGYAASYTLDDFLLLDQDRTKLIEHTATTLSLFEALGFLVNYPKSVLEPTQKLIFLGFIIDSIMKELSLPQEKMDIIIKKARGILELQKVSARSLTQLIGKMSAALLAVQPAPLHYRSLQNLNHIALRRKGYDSQIWLSSAAHKDLEWWIHNSGTAEQSRHWI